MAVISLLSCSGAIHKGQNSYFGPSIVTRGSISSLIFQNGRLDPQALVLGSISSYNYEDDRRSPQTCNLGSISSLNYQSAFNILFST